MPEVVASVDLTFGLVNLGEYLLAIRLADV